MEIFFSLFVSSRSLAGGDVRGCVFRERGGDVVFMLELEGRLEKRNNQGW